MNKVISALFKYGIPVLISVGLVWFLYNNVDLDAIRESLRHDVDYRWFIPAAVVSVMSHVFRAMRWRLQLRAIDVRPPLSALCNSIFGTYFVNLLFPRLGEVWRCGYIARRENASFPRVVGSMVGDRLSDTLTVALLTLVTFVLAHDKLLSFLQLRDGDGGAAGPSWVLWLTVALAVLAVLAVVWVWRSRAATGPVARVRGVLVSLWDGLASIFKMKGKWWFLMFTVLIWGSYYLQLYIASLAFTFTRDLGPLAILVLFILSSLGMAVPSNGGLGPWQVAIIFGLSLYGVGTMTGGYDAQASAFAWLVWCAQTLLLIVLGIYAFVSIALERKNSCVNVNRYTSLKNNK